MYAIAEANNAAFLDLDNQNKQYFEDLARYQTKIYDSPYTEDQKEDMQKMGINSAMRVNTADYIVTALVGLSYSNNNAVSVIGSPKKALLWQAVLSKLMKNTNFRLHVHEAYLDKYIGGMGFMLVEADSSEDNFLGAKAKYIPVMNCRWPLVYSDPLMEDVDTFIYYDIITLKSALIRLGEEYNDAMLEGIYNQAQSVFPDLLKAPTFSAQRSVFGASGRLENRPVPFIKSYTKEFQNYIELVRYNDDKTKIDGKRLVPKVSDNMEDDVMSYFMRYTDDSRVALAYIGDYKDGKGAMKPLKQERVVCRSSIGGYDNGNTEVLPTQFYPFVPFRYKKVRYGNPVGVMKQVEGLDLAINHTLTIQIASGRAACGLTVFVGEGNDPDEIKTRMESINKVIPLKVTDLGGGKVFTVDVHQMQPIGEHFGSLMDRLMLFAEISTGTDDLLRNGAVVGNQQPGQAGGGMQRISSIKFRPHMDLDQAALSKVARVLIDYVKAYSKPDKIVRMFESDQALVDAIMSEEEIVSSTVDAPGFNLEIPINQRIATGEGRILYFNDLKNTDADVEVTMTAMPATEDIKRFWAEGFLNTMRELPMSSIDLLEEYLSLLGHPGARRIGKKMVERQQTEAKIVDMQKTIERLQREVTLSQQQTIRANKAAELAKFKTDLQQDRMEIKLLIESTKAGENPEEGLAKADEMLQRWDAKLSAILEQENFVDLETVSETIQ